MFVAGELEILMTKISKSEYKGRIRFLKKIVYFASLYDLKRLLQYYAAWPAASKWAWIRGMMIFR